MTIPESLLIEVWKLATTREVWNTVCEKHEKTALTVKVDMRQQMYEMKCEDDLNVHMHLEVLLQMQEQLAGMEAGLTDDDFVTIILGSLPKSY